MVKRKAPPVKNVLKKKAIDNFITEFATDTQKIAQNEHQKEQVEKLAKVLEDGLNEIFNPPEKPEEEENKNEDEEKNEGSPLPPEPLTDEYQAMMNSGSDHSVPESNPPPVVAFEPEPPPHLEMIKKWSSVFRIFCKTMEYLG